MQAAASCLKLYCTLCSCERNTPWLMYLCVRRVCSLGEPRSIVGWKARFRDGRTWLEGRCRLCTRRSARAEGGASDPLHVSCDSHGGVLRSKDESPRTESAGIGVTCSLLALGVSPCHSPSPGGHRVLFRATGVQTQERCKVLEDHVGWETYCGRSGIDSASGRFLWVPHSSLVTA